MTEKKIIGRKDYADFPELGIKKLAVKIDTGAYTSSIHCHKIEEIIIDEVLHIQFELLDPSHKKYNNQVFVSANFKQKKIKSSTGHAEKRYIIKTIITLFGEDLPIELSLTERTEMKYPVLIGRKLLRKNFLVDPSKVNISYKRSKNQ